LKAETSRFVEYESDGSGVPATEGAAEVVRRGALACDWIGRVKVASVLCVRGEHGEGVLAAGADEAVARASVLLRLYARTGHFEEAVRTVVGGDVEGDAAIAAYVVAFVAKVERLERMKGMAGCGRRCG